jgi:hypothetical protein
MKQEDDGVVRFCVEADYHGDCDEAAVVFYPESHEEAVNVFDHLSSRYTCVWLCEYGEYRTGSEWVRDWMYYKWTSATGWGSCEGRFTGYPCDDIDRATDYFATYRDGRRVPGV